MATFTTTILASSSRALLNTVRASLKSSKKDTNFLFTVSSNADADLGSIISYASSLGKNSLGCISAPPQGRVGQAFSFSVAAFPAGISTPFESDIPGRVQAQVGRIRGLISKRSRDSVGAAKREFERVLDEGGSLGGFESDTGDMIPDGLDLTMKYNSLLFFSDNQAEGLCTSLDKHFSNAHKVGLVGTSTPFITGRPFTLLHNGRALSHGAVGLAINHASSVFDRGFDNLEPISSLLEVTSSQANLVHSLGKSNPSKLLLEAINTSTPRESNDPSLNAKDEEYYLGQIEPESGSFINVYNIISGDPSRGSLALGGDDGPPIGAHVQMLRRSHSLFALPALEGQSPTIHFITSPADPLSDFQPSSDDDKVTIIENSFLAFSENGLLVSPLKDGPISRSFVAGGWASLGWKDTQ